MVVPHYSSLCKQKYVTKIWSWVGFIQLYLTHMLLLMKKNPTLRDRKNPWKIIPLYTDFMRNYTPINSDFMRNLCTYFKTTTYFSIIIPHYDNIDIQYMWRKHQISNQIHKIRIWCPDSLYLVPGRDYLQGGPCASICKQSGDLNCGALIGWPSFMGGASFA